MKCCSRSFLALMRRNLIYRKRRWLGSTLEFLLPPLALLVLLVIKVSLKDSVLAAKTVPASFAANRNAIVPFGFKDYVTALQAQRRCLLSPFLRPYISGINPVDWPVPFVFCNSPGCKTPGQDARTLCTYRVLALAPSQQGGQAASRVQSFKAYVEKTYPQIKNKTLMPFDYDFIKVFQSNAEMDSYVTSDGYGSEVNGVYQPKIAIAVVFGDGGDKDYAYTIRVNSTNFNSQEQAGRRVAPSTPPSDRAFNNFNKNDDSSCSGGPRLGEFRNSCTGQYMYNGAIPIQRLVDDWILKDAGVTVRVAENGVVFVPYPVKEYQENGFYSRIAAFAPLIITLGLLFPVASNIRAVVAEKELRQKELMKMMSISEAEIGWSWFLSLFLFFLPSAILTTVFTVLLYAKSSFGIVVIFWILTYVAWIVFCLFIAAISTKATRATLVGILIFFVGYFIPLAADVKTGNQGAISLLSLHPVTAYTYGLTMVGFLEDAGVGVTLTTLRATDFPSRFAFGNAIGSLIIDCLWSGVIGWYLNRVLRGDFGTALPWYFLCTRQYWCGGKRPHAEPSEDVAALEGVPIEPVSEQLKQQEMEGRGVHIRGLRRQFGGKMAVDGLSLSMYSGQITALLGHNGAGKTTTIGMLTGMIPPTSGYATVAGYDIRSDLASLRENVGICLQHDCLFPMLTVKEHLTFFARVKGVYERKSYAEAEKSVMSTIEDVALLEKRATYSKDLSGGMKRKLSVAIAFCGDSKVVFLDEPTSGMDPFSRRFTWSVIRQYRENRCIVLTTHFMDEADLLGDRIAIMAEGRLRCAGSSLFLKRHYGVGYQLTVIKGGGKSGRAKDEDAGNVEAAPVMGIDAGVQSIVKQAVPEATLLSNVGTEMSFQLPIGASAAFVGMFERLDERIRDRDVETYGVSVTTLDEVFLMVARGEHVNAEAESIQADVVTETEAAPSHNFQLSTDVGKQSTFSRHITALFAKRAKNFKRDKKAWCCSSILPVLMTLVGFLVVSYVVPSRSQKSLALTLENYNPVVSNSKRRNPIPFNNPGAFSCQPGRCMYSTPRVKLNATGEEYSFCGLHAGINSNSSFLASCSISETKATVDRVTQFGAFGVGQSVTDIESSSQGVWSTSSKYEASSYGAFFFTHDQFSNVTSANGSRSYTDAVSGVCRRGTGNYTSADECSFYEGIGFVVSYNYTSLHGSLLYQSLADEAILRQSRNDGNYNIAVTVHPLPITAIEKTYSESEDAFAAWFLLVLSYPFITGSFATFIVAEREFKAKHLQTVAGVQPSAYWFSSYIWDIINYQIPLWSIIILMYAIGIDPFITEDNKAAGATIALLILFGPAAAGLTYIISFAFKSPSMANLFVIVFNFVVGMAAPLVCFILRLLASDPNSNLGNLKTAAIAVEWVLRFIPSFCLGKGLFYVINVDAFSFIDGEKLDALSPSIALIEIIFLGWQSVVYVLLAIRVDKLSTKPKVVQRWRDFVHVVSFKWIFAGRRKAEDQIETRGAQDDEDVVAEVRRVNTGGADGELIVLKSLTKQYDNGKRAVNDMSLGIPPGQCFGLLGINGAGKTTTMAILTAEFPPSSGDAYLAGFSVSNEPEQTRRRIGYCPQFDAHFMNMTGREHVELYAAIKGVPSNVVKEAAAAKLKEVGLSAFDSDRLSSGYSGGMKRKLSVACATIGQPQIVFLDEPSTGMDPVARRDLWKVISKMIQGTGPVKEADRTSVILTTHSMEECEALCSRIGIMAGGKLRCLGSAQHLKTRFGRGFQIEMKVKHVGVEDDDAKGVTQSLFGALSGTLQASADAEAGGGHSTLAFETFMNIAQAQDACRALTGDDYLSAMLHADNTIGYRIYKAASAPAGVSVNDLAGFCVEEMRMRSLLDFFNKAYASAILRERQDNKVRFEIAAEGVSISSVFAKIEEQKDRLRLDDYSVSQTSLEQVFNMHAAEAETAKQNTVDGARGA